MQISLSHPEECLRARDILERHGFVSRPLKSPLYNKIIMFIGNHIPEMHKNGISVDIHHRLFGTEGISLTKKGIENSEAIKISGTLCQILPPRIAFLGMIKHLQKHDLKGEFQVRLFVDLYLMLKYYGEKILSDNITSEAETAGISKELASGLYLVSHYWNFPVHEKYTALLTSSEKEAISSYFIEGLTNPGISVTGGFNDLYRSNLDALPGTKNKLIFLLGDIFPSFSFMKGRYNCKTLFCIFIHYPYRIGKIFWFIRSLIRH